MAESWNHQSVPSQRGKVAIVTGANSGIGLETARALAARGATVILACRSRERGEQAVRDIVGSHPEARVRFMALDLADLDQVATFAAEIHREFDRLDLLINNAGVMMPPASKTRQGFELQFGVNHLGHFALTGRLLDLLLSTPASRVVTVSSLAHRQGKLNVQDLDWESRRYRKIGAYGQSKLANLLFHHELDRRLRTAGVDTLATAAHPGWTATNLQQHTGLVRAFNPLFGMTPREGALPTLRAATDPTAKSGDYFGPNGLGELRGTPVAVRSHARARNEADAAKLWEISEARTGVRFDILRPHHARAS